MGMMSRYVKLLHSECLLSDSMDLRRLQDSLSMQRMAFEAARRLQLLRPVLCTNFHDI